MLLAFTNGTIETMAGGPRPDVVIVDRGRIEAVGDRDLLTRYGGASVVDLRGNTLVPGLIDAHHHLSIACMQPVWADLTGVADIDTAAALLRDAATRSPDTPWIRGCRWEPERLRLRRRDLDALGFDRPIVLACMSLHRAVVSSAGLDALHIDAATTDPPGGHIERDDSGAPTGLLWETAWSAAHAASMRGYDDTDRYLDLIVDRAQLLLSYGVTAVHDTAMSPNAEAAYRLLAAQQRLPVSILGFPHAAELLTGPDPRRWDGPRTGDGNETFRIGPVKIFADGPFAPACSGHIGGELLEVGDTMPYLAEQIAAAVQHGYGVATHAIGNRGLAATLDAWETATRAVEPGHGLRVEHVVLAGQREIQQMRRLGATGVVQPGFVGAVGDRTVGFAWDDLAWFPFANLLNSGVALAASSDSPCSTTPDPLPLTAFGVHRTTPASNEIEPDQSVPLREWLRLWTAGAADAGSQTDERGRIRPGLRADFAVLEGNLDSVDDLRVVETWVLGSRAYARAAATAT